LYVQEALKLYFVFKECIDNGKPIDYSNEQTFGQKNKFVVKSKDNVKFMLGFVLEDGDLQVKFDLDKYDFKTFMLFLKEQSIYFLTNDYLDFTKTKKTNKSSDNEEIFDSEDDDSSGLDW
jgi:hypothetical protein